MSDFAWMCLMLILIGVAIALPEIISAWRFGGRDISARQLRNRVARGETYTVVRRKRRPTRSE